MRVCNYEMFSDINATSVLMILGWYRLER